MPTARAVANEFIRLAGGEGRALTPLQIMKLVYIAYGWALHLFQRQIFRDRIEAWRYGPVIPDLYRAMKKYGGDPVTEDLPHAAGDLAQEDKALVAQVYRVYGDLNGIQLSSLTHQPKTPWAQTTVQGGYNGVISNDLIAEHYRQLGAD